MLKLGQFKVTEVNDTTIALSRIQTAASNRISNSDLRPESNDVDFMPTNLKNKLKLFEVNYEFKYTSKDNKYVSIVNQTEKTHVLLTLVMLMYFFVLDKNGSICCNPHEHNFASFIPNWNQTTFLGVSFIFL